MTCFWLPFTKDILIAAYSFRQVHPIAISGLIQTGVSLTERLKNTLNSWACGLCFNNAGLRESQMARERKREISVHLNGSCLFHLLATSMRP